MAQSCLRGPGSTFKESMSDLASDPLNLLHRAQSLGDSLKIRAAVGIVWQKNSKVGRRFQFKCFFLDDDAAHDCLSFDFLHF